MQRLFESASLRNVRLQTDETDQSTVVVAHRRDEQSVPKRLPAFAIIENFDRALPAGSNRLAQPGDDFRIGSFALQKSAISPDDLRGGIAGETLET